MILQQRDLSGRDSPFQKFYIRFTVPCVVTQSLDQDFLPCFTETGDPLQDRGISPDHFQAVFTECIHHYPCSRGSDSRKGFPGQKPDNGFGFIRKFSPSRQDPELPPESWVMNFFPRQFIYLFLLRIRKPPCTCERMTV